MSLPAAAASGELQLQIAPASSSPRKQIFPSAGTTRTGPPAVFTARERSRFAPHIPATRPGSASPVRWARRRMPNDDASSAAIWLTRGSTQAGGDPVASGGGALEPPVAVATPAAAPTVTALSATSVTSLRGIRIGLFL